MGKKKLLKIILPLYMTVFQSIGTCPKVAFKKCIMILFIFLIQEVVLDLYLNSCCFLLLVEKLRRTYCKGALQNRNREILACIPV